MAPRKLPWYLENYDSSKIMIPRKLWYLELLTLSEIKKLLNWQWWWGISRISVNLLIQWLYCSSTSFWSCWNCSSTQLTNTQSHFLLFYFYLLFFVYFLKILLNTSNALGGLRLSELQRDETGVRLGLRWNWDQCRTGVGWVQTHE